jgi:hypothetical protein
LGGSYINFTSTNNINKEKINKKEKVCEIHKNEELAKWHDEVFWNEWPKHFRKTDKTSSFKAICKALKENKQITTETILKALKWWKNSENWAKENGQYIPAPTVWINKKRWEVIENIPNGQNEVAPIQQEQKLPEVKRAFASPQEFAASLSKILTSPEVT